MLPTSETTTEAQFRPPNEVLTRIKDINEAFAARLGAMERERERKLRDLQTKLKEEEEDHRARAQKIKDEMLALEEEWRRQADKVNEERKTRLRAFHEETARAKEVLNDWLRHLNDALVTSEPQGAEARQETSAREGGQHPRPSAGKKSEGEEEEETEEGRRRRAGAVTHAHVASSSSSSYNEREDSSGKRKSKESATREDRNGDDEDDADDERDSYSAASKRARSDDPREKARRKSGEQQREAGVEEVDTSSSSIPIEESARKTPPKSHLLDARSSDPKDLDNLFESLIVTHGGKPKLLVDLFRLNSKAKVGHVEGLHTRELRRATTCRACSGKIEKSCYTGIIGETGKRCESHKFCEKCGEYIFARFEDKCPGRFWFNCA